MQSRSNKYRQFQLVNKCKITEFFCIKIDSKEQLSLRILFIFLMAYI